MFKLIYFLFLVLSKSDKFLENNETVQHVLVYKIPNISDTYKRMLYD